MAKALPKPKSATLVRYLPKHFDGKIDDLHVDDIQKLEDVQASKVKPAVRYSARRYRDGEPPDERLAHTLKGDVSVGDDQQGGKIFTINCSPLLRMFRNKSIDGTQFTALSKFHSYWWNACLSESVRSVDLNRIYAPDPFSISGMSKSEREYHNRREYRAAYKLISHHEGILVTNLICSESCTLEDCGYAMGYRSPYRARAAATKIVCSIADRFAKLWGIG